LQPKGYTDRNDKRDGGYKAKIKLNLDASRALQEEA